MHSWKRGAPTTNSTTPKQISPAVTPSAIAHRISVAETRAMYPVQAITKPALGQPI
jgi:hypothetical protein